MSDTLDFAQKISMTDFSRQRMHFFVLKHHLLDMRKAARYIYSDLSNNVPDKYNIVKDANQITTKGLFRLTENSINYDNPVPGPKSLPDLDYAFLYVMPLTDMYIRQYTLIASDGYTLIKTRLGTYIRSKLQWGKWRPYSDSNPMYEILSETEARVNETYLSFGNYDLVLPDPKLCKVGDVIRLDQWKGSGNVVQKRLHDNRYEIVKKISTYPAVIGTCEKITCIGLDGQNPVEFEHESALSWISNSYQITVELYNDSFYWVIASAGTVLYRSTKSIFTCSFPTNAIYTLLETATTASLSFTVDKVSNEAKDIDSCKTYEFEVFNDTDINNSNYNYWCVFIYDNVKEYKDELNLYFEKSINSIYRRISDTHERITETSRYITMVSAQLGEYITSVLNQHTSDINTLTSQIEKYHPATPPATQP